MSTAPLVSFVVPTYRAASFLGACLDSIFAQTARADFEIIVINDASPDETDAVMGAFDDPRVRYVRHAQNQGHVSTINEGLVSARGAYIARIDSDDLYRPYFLERTLPIFDTYPQVGMVYSDVALIDTQGNVLAHKSDAVHGGCDFCGDEYMALLRENFVPAPTVIARRETWVQALPIPDGLGFTDWYLSLRMARAYPLYFLNVPLAEYRIHPNNFHNTMVRDYSEEQTIFRLLDAAFAEPDHVAEKRAQRHVIYAAQYARLADKYFGCAMFADARRCYRTAFRFAPRALGWGKMRRWLATYNPAFYHNIKTRLKEQA